MSNSAIPVNVVIGGITISEVLSFRYGQQLQEQRFFELKFRQALLGSIFSFATDDANRYINQPITLLFDGSLGRTTTVSGTIVKLEFINNTGQPSEVLVTGTAYQPSGKLSKFALAMIALLALPLLFTGYLSCYVAHLSGSLVKTNGSITYFQDHMGKGTHRYTFNIAPYKASFYRAYHAPVLNTAHQNIDALFKDQDGGYEPGRKGQAIDFYVFKSDLPRLDDPQEKIAFFDLRSAKQQLIKVDHYDDILIYATDQTWFYWLWIFYLFGEVCCFTAALFCYKMYALDQQRKYRIIWFSCIALGVLFNIFVLSLLL